MSNNIPDTLDPTFRTLNRAPQKRLFNDQVCNMLRHKKDHHNSGNCKSYDPLGATVLDQLRPNIRPLAHWPDVSKRSIGSLRLMGSVLGLGFRV